VRDDLNDADVEVALRAFFGDEELKREVVPGGHMYTIARDE
jgi:hypothetical protein